MYLLLSLTFLIGIIIRFYLILPPKTPSKAKHHSKPSSSYTLAVFLGSGGHTSEALQLISSLDFSQFSTRIYVISQGDTLSAQKAHHLEQSKGKGGITPHFKIVTIPRARKVHQSLFTTLPTTLWTLLFCIIEICFKPKFNSSSRSTNNKFADIFILNGPGTCIPLSIAIYINKFFGIPSPKVIYIESFARVNSLSLSAKLLRPFADRLIVQWPEAIKDGKRGECHGWLV